MIPLSRRKRQNKTNCAQQCFIFHSFMELSICKSLVTGETPSFKETLSAIDDTVYGLGIITPKYLAFHHSHSNHQSNLLDHHLLYIYRSSSFISINYLYVYV